MTLTGGFSSNEEHASEMFLPAERRTLREESARASLCFLSYNEVEGVFFFHQQSSAVGVNVSFWSELLLFLQLFRSSCTPSCVFLFPKSETSAAEL